MISWCRPKQLEERYGKKIVEQLSVPQFEGTPHYISAVTSV